MIDYKRIIERAKFLVETEFDLARNMEKIYLDCRQYHLLAGTVARQEAMFDVLEIIRKLETE